MHRGHVVPETIHEGRVIVKQAPEGGHVVRVPGGLERFRRILWLG